MFRHQAFAEEVEDDTLPVGQGGHVRRLLMVPSGMRTMSHQMPHE
jgi:hypothetical protein